MSITGGSPVRNQKPLNMTTKSPLMKRFLNALAALMLLSLLSGCTSFDHDWRHARMQPPARNNQPTGAWQGTWLSDVNGHTGDLRCLVTQKNDDEYEFRFKATYWKLFRFSYTVTLPVECKPEACTFKGSEDLGYLAGGVYHYAGSIQNSNLNATYSCKFDHGIFKLSRP